MKRFALLLTLVILLSLGCSPSRLTGGGDDAATEIPPPHSETRCGDSVCDGAENPQNCPQDCAPAREDTAATPVSSEPDTNTPPPWFAPDPNCQMGETTALSEGSPWAFDSEGNATELLSDGQATCVLEIWVCGDRIFKQQVVEPGEGCPESLHFSRAPRTEVCCAKWEEAKHTGAPCNPLEDADCDGVPNDSDAYPLDFSQQ